MAVYETIEELILQGLKKRLISQIDVIYVRNQIFSLLNLDGDGFQNAGVTASEACESSHEEIEIPELLEKLVDYAVEQEIIEDYFDAKEILSAKIMNVFLPRPSEVDRTFFIKYEQSPEAATSYFYQLSQNSNYIQTSRIKKNIEYVVPTEFGDIDITINLSKPEKDPKQIALERMSKKASGYPTCVLCIENEGYAGRLGYAARSNHRMIRLQLQNEQWYFQYSPYLYYNEHCIVLSGEHRNMEISKKTFSRLIEFIDLFPHYFIGSNADIPIVGGSILTHDHYQAGRYEFAMAKAKEELFFKIDRYPNVSCSVVKWPMSVIRLSSTNKEELIELATDILEKWKRYSDPITDIQANTDETPHNTITPIARRRGGKYELDLVLRNNRTSDEHPLGIFHPHADVHHIKKENIGLIEVMGLAVLPARLKDELVEVEKFLLNKPSSVADYHLAWAERMKADYKDINQDNVSDIVRKEVGHIFLKGLMDAGVFKRDEKGRAAFIRFIENIDGKIE